jgi:hypothetical protein
MFKYILICLALISTSAFAASKEELVNKYGSTDAVQILRRTPIAANNKTYHSIGQIFKSEQIDENTIALIMGFPVYYNVRTDMSEMMDPNSNFKNGTNVRNVKAMVIILKTNEWEGLNVSDLSTNTNYFIIGDYVVNHKTNGVFGTVPLLMGKLILKYNNSPNIDWMKVNF